MLLPVLVLMSATVPPPSAPPEESDSGLKTWELALIVGGACIASLVLLAVVLRYCVQSKPDGGGGVPVQPTVDRTEKDASAQVINQVDPTDGERDVKDVVQEKKDDPTLSVIEAA